MQITRSEMNKAEVSRDARKIAHGMKMDAKKDARKNVARGFTPSPQQRTDGKIAMLTTVNMGKGMWQKDAYSAAIRELLPISHVKPFEKSIVHMHRRIQRKKLAQLKREQAILEGK